MTGGVEEAECLLTTTSPLSILCLVFVVPLNEMPQQVFMLAIEAKAAKVYRDTRNAGSQSLRPMTSQLWTWTVQAS